MTNSSSSVMDYTPPGDNPQSLAKRASWFITVAELAAQLAMPIHETHRLLRRYQGQLITVEVGGLIYIDYSSWEKALAADIPPPISQVLAGEEGLADICARYGFSPPGTAEPLPPSPEPEPVELSDFHFHFPLRDGKVKPGERPDQPPTSTRPTYQNGWQGRKRNATSWRDAIGHEMLGGRG